MSGHSHFRTIKAQKELADAKRGQLFSKLARLITIAVKEGGKDPLVNSKLKTAIEQAKRFNMPKENIERAVKKGAGELADENLEEFSLEGFGPGGIAIIVEGITDNKNRTISEIKSMLSQHDGKLSSEGAVKWMFDRKGLVAIEPGQKTREELELAAIESGAEDIRQEGNTIYIYTKPEELESVRKSLEEKSLKIEEAGIEWVSKEDVAVSDKDKENLQKLFETLDENDAIQNIYSNLKNPLV